MQQCLYSIETCADLRIIFRTIFRTILRIILRTLLFITQKRLLPNSWFGEKPFIILV